MLKKFNVGIIGGGILGVCISYWLSLLYDIKVCVIEQESNVALHTSSRNTGVVHSPFYLDPSIKKTLARCAYQSRDMWEKLAKKFNLAWSPIGTIQVAQDNNQHKTLEKYLKWGISNGLSEKQIFLLDSNQVSKKEPFVSCYSGLQCTSDVSVDFGAFTNILYKESKRLGTSFLLSKRVKKINTDNIITLDDNSNLKVDFLINCAGGSSLEICKKINMATSYSSLCFRGEYWIAQKKYADLIRTNIYSVARMQEFPFLNPHWIRRANGTSEIGPNAVLVPTPFSYGGLAENILPLLSKFTNILCTSSRKLLFDSKFLSLVYNEFQSSISKDAMISRVKQFIPKANSNWFNQRGTAGIRTPVISPEGKFIPDVLELGNDNSFHIINYNSPGATGAPAYSAHIIKKLQRHGYLNLTKTKQHESVWDFDKID